MAVSTDQIRAWWAPPCRGPWITVNLYGAGRVSVRPAIKDALSALNSCLIAANYATRAKDTGAYNCRNVTGGSKKSLHAYGIAVDLNWQSNPYGRRLITDMPISMRSNIKSIRTNNGKQVWRWGGDYSGNKDAMHYEITCSPRDLATGINWKTVPGQTVAKSNKVLFKPGDRSNGVKFIEVLLNKYFRPAPQIKLREDGVYDNQTTAGVREFQLSHNKLVKAAQRLRTDGIVDERTLEAISFWIALKTKG